MGCKRLGDLDGLSYDVVLKKRDCGQKTISELELLINQLQSGELKISQTNSRTSSSMETLDLPIENLGLSVRAYNSLRWHAGIRTVRELVQKSEIELLGYKNFGRTSLQEVKDILASMNLRLKIGASEEQAIGDKWLGSLRIFIPQNARGWVLAQMPLSTRLASIFERKGFRLLGDLHGVSFEQVRRAKNCGRRTIAELELLVHRIQSGELDVIQTCAEELLPSHLVRLVDEAVEKMALRERGMLLSRFGGAGNEPMTLEEIGAKYNLTRERVRQIVDKTIKQIQKLVWLSFDESVRSLSERCMREVCPLTPQLFAQWLGPQTSVCRFAITFYIRFFNEISPEFPGWPDGQKPGHNDKKSKQIISHLKETIRGKMTATPLIEAFEKLKEANKFRYLTAGEFLIALKKDASLKVEFVRPDYPQIKQAAFSARELAWAILSKSERPLTPDEIIEKADESMGEDFSPPSPFSIANSLKPEDGFYLLNPRSYGLRRHFRLPESMWRKVREDFRKLLTEENRPVSTIEIISEERFEWVSLTNSYEVAQVLREDKRFIDLGRFLFALSDWGIEEREYVSDLIPKVLEQVGHPMIATDIHKELKRVRSVTPTGISAITRKNEDVKDYGFGFYGLKSWGDDVRDFLVSESRLVNRIIVRADRPLPFGQLCQILEVSSEGPLAEKLWKTVRSLSKVKTEPKIRTAQTLLTHSRWSFERALYVTLAGSDRPMRAFEAQWEMNDRFGPAFRDKSLSDIVKCLQQSRLFVRNKNDEYSLNLALEESGLDVATISRSCQSILLNCNEVVGCDDLLERLEAEGLGMENLTASMLAALLRNDAAFDEVLANHFRISNRAISELFSAAGV